MHCHFLNHMMMGMMGSLLIVKGSEFASTLPRGVPCEMPEMGGGGMPPNGAYADDCHRQEHEQLLVER